MWIPTRMLIGPSRRPPAPRRRQRPPRRPSERQEERVALGVDLDAAVAGERVAQHAPMLRQRLGVALPTQVVEQARRTLDVGEEERDGAGGELTLHRLANDGALVRHRHKWLNTVRPFNG